MNIEILNDYKERGLLMNQLHPTLPLIIWNYTAECQYSRSWDEITIQARGLVTDFDGNIISRGFNKFFNLEENRHVPTDNFEVFEKLDGQYIGIFWYNGEMVVNSRGSFDSIYAIEARRILDEKYPTIEKTFSEYHTYCFELIGFEQIVVSYSEPDLILTGGFHTKLGHEILFNEQFCKICDYLNVKYVKKYSGLDYKNIKQLNWKNAEGFVVRFSNGDRCKIKFEDYIKLHRQMTNLSTIAIWEALMDGKPISSILENVPDEFFDKIHEYEDYLITKFNGIETDSKWEFLATKNHIKNKSFESNNTEYRKDFAHCTQKSKYPSILFAMLDGKDYSKIIWKLIKPKFEKI